MLIDSVALQLMTAEETGDGAVPEPFRTGLVGQALPLRFIPQMLSEGLLHFIDFSL